MSSATCISPPSTIVPVEETIQSKRLTPKQAAAASFLDGPLAVVTRQGKLLALSDNGTAAFGNQYLMTGKGVKTMLSLDGKDLRISEAILVAARESGRIELMKRSGCFVATVGEFRDGKYVAHQRLCFEGRKVSLVIDADRAACLILVCREGTEQRWARYLTETLLLASSWCARRARKNDRE